MTQPNINPADLKLLPRAVGIGVAVGVRQDGTSTFVKVSGPSISGEGTARRRKGDPRNPELGRRLAIARALKAAADRAAKQLDDDGYQV